MDLQGRIVKIVDYFRGLDIKGGLYIIKAEFPERWGVVQDDKGIIKVAKSETAVNEYFYYGKIEETKIDDIFDLIEMTITMNKSAEAKINLMREKVEELKELFGTNTLEDLQRLKFVIEEKKVRKTKPRATKKTAKADKPKRKYTRKPKLIVANKEEILENLEKDKSQDFGKVVYD